jgi:hypothetical protein
MRYTPTPPSNIFIGLDLNFKLYPIFCFNCILRRILRENCFCYEKTSFVHRKTFLSTVLWNQDLYIVIKILFVIYINSRKKLYPECADKHTTSTCHTHYVIRSLDDITITWCHRRMILLLHDINRTRSLFNIHCDVHRRHCISTLSYPLPQTIIGRSECTISCLPCELSVKIKKVCAT